MNDNGRGILILVIALIILPLLWGGMIMGGGMGMMGGWGPADGWDRWDPWRAGFGMLSTLLVVGGIGAVVWWAFGRTAPASPPSGRPGEAGARDILDARYARGEITREQYQQMRRDLES